MILSECPACVPAFICFNSQVETQGRRCHHIGQLFGKGLWIEQYCVLADIRLPLLDAI